MKCVDCEKLQQNYWGWAICVNGRTIRVIYGNEVENGERPEWCPLIEVGEGEE